MVPAMTTKRVHIKKAHEVTHGLSKNVLAAGLGIHRHKLAVSKGAKDVTTPETIT
jgi:hypothetical protein